MNWSYKLSTLSCPRRVRATSLLSKFPFVPLLVFETTCPWKPQFLALQERWRTVPSPWQNLKRLCPVVYLHIKSVQFMIVFGVIHSQMYQPVSGSPSSIFWATRTFISMSSSETLKMLDLRNSLQRTDESGAGDQSAWG